MRKLRLMRCFVGPHCFVYVLHHASRLNKTPHFWGLRTPVGAITPKFELGRDFCAMHLPPKFHHPMFSCLEVIVLTNTSTHKHIHTQTHTQTNKQILLKTSNVLHYTTTFGNHGTLVTALLVTLVCKSLSLVFCCFQ